MEHTAALFIYVFTVMTMLGLAIEIGKRITGTGEMDFGDVVAGMCGVLAFFAVDTVYRVIALLFGQKGIRQKRSQRLKYNRKSPLRRW